MWSPPIRTRRCWTWSSPSDPPAEIIVSTLPRTRSGWMRRDLIERLRDRVDVPVAHVEADIRIDPAESR